jgi:uncharacterized protein (TIGR03437 family)
MRAITPLLLPIAATVLLAADSTTPVVVSSASPNIGVASDSLATIYGNQLATQTASAPSLPWPTRLGDLPVVWVTDSTSKAQMASLSYVSPSQVNIWIPSGTAPGPATVSFPVTGLPLGVGTAALRIVPVTIQKVAPGLFSANGTGSGVAAASAVRIAIPTQLQGPVSVFQCDAPATCTAVPIDVGLDAPVYLSFYGTGIRGASSLSNVNVTIGATKIQPTYAGPQGELPGLDQVNVPLSLSLRGSGLVNVTVTVDGVTSNAVQINIQ